MTKKKAKTDLTLVGYARVSTVDQSAQMQIEALLDAGVHRDQIFSENLSGAKKNRPALAKAMRQLRKGDTLVVWKLDRVARSIKHLLDILEELESRDIEFLSLTDNIDTKSPGGKLIIHIMGSIAEFERNLGIQRSREGVRRAQDRGVKFGREHKIPLNEDPTLWKLVHEKGMTRAAVAKKYKVTVQTISRRLTAYEERIAKQAKKKKPSKR